jgi:hypothetical protein
VMLSREPHCYPQVTCLSQCIASDKQQDWFTLHMHAIPAMPRNTARYPFLIQNQFNMLDFPIHVVLIGVLS